MLRRISTVAAAAAMLGLSALPAAAATSVAHASSGKFTVPSASSSVKSWGTYDIINAHRVQVTICTKITGSAFFVIGEAIAYNASLSQHDAIAAAVGQETPGGESCSHANLLYTAHLKVFTEIGSGGRIVAKSALKTIY
jgi:hypothetical protein